MLRNPDFLQKVRIGNKLGATNDGKASVIFTVGHGDSEPSKVCRNENQQSYLANTKELRKIEVSGHDELSAYRNASC